VTGWSPAGGRHLHRNRQNPPCRRGHRRCPARSGYAEPEAARLCWALVYFTLGLTQEQQTSPPESEIRAVDLADEGTYPALAKVGVGLLVHDSFDARFNYGLTQLLRPA
jgi:TetR/AcrR family tetracycline transcriptional repressor